MRNKLLLVAAGAAGVAGFAAVTIFAYVESCGNPSHWSARLIRGLGIEAAIVNHAKRKDGDPQD